MEKSNEVGKRIRLMREERGWLQRDLAKKINVSDKAVSAWETGVAEPRMGAIAKLCEVFHCKVSDLTGQGSWVGTPVEDTNELFKNFLPSKEYLQGQLNESQKEIQALAHEVIKYESTDEERLLRAYRKLNPDQKQRLKDYIYDLLTEGD